MRKLFEPDVEKVNRQIVDVIFLLLQPKRITTPSSSKMKKTSVSDELVALMVKMLPRVTKQFPFSETQNNLLKQLLVGLGTFFLDY